MNNNGSNESPWSTIEEVIANNLIETQSYNPMPYIQGVSSLFSINPDAPVKAGDTIYLRSGLHEKLIISGAYNAKTVTITTEQGHQTVFIDSSNSGRQPVETNEPDSEYLTLWFLYQRLACFSKKTRKLWSCKRCGHRLFQYFQHKKQQRME